MMNRYDRVTNSAEFFNRRLAQIKCKLQSSQISADICANLYLCSFLTWICAHLCSIESQHNSLHDRQVSEIDLKIELLYNNSNGGEIEYAYTHGVDHKSHIADHTCIDNGHAIDQ